MQGELERFLATMLDQPGIEICHVANTGESLRWLPLLTIGDAGRVGIASDGRWVHESQNSAAILAGSQTFARIEIMLERPIEHWIEELQKVVCAHNADVSPYELFPFALLVRSILDLAISPYWVALALDWYDRLSVNTQAGLAQSLVALTSNARMTQRLRHDVGKRLAARGWRAPRLT